jgi:hypothetical protein
MFVCLKDWFNTEARDRDHSNMYDISEYSTSILFFVTKFTSFVYFFYIFFQFYLKFMKFISPTSVDMSPAHINKNMFNMAC